MPRPRDSHSHSYSYSHLQHRLLAVLAAEVGHCFDRHAEHHRLIIVGEFDEPCLGDK
ncbi:MULTISPECIES: hypothetical protein [Pelagerythrobacter]|uniref:hypothetical protein n=1 Tax=Pelagerythrobacter TaxID=2800685 RepID=UPI001602A29F|nr:MULTISPECIES: hypothetical protein [Pelagerythrobacter]WPZ07633.1 hypothetical protein T8T98_03715 [Pelagerythrobacter marinus]